MYSVQPPPWPTATPSVQLRAPLRSLLPCLRGVKGLTQIDCSAFWWVHVSLFGPCSTLPSVGCAHLLAVEPFPQAQASYGASDPSMSLGFTTPTWLLSSVVLVSPVCWGHCSLGCLIAAASSMLQHTCPAPGTNCGCSRLRLVGCGTLLLLLCIHSDAYSDAYTLLSWQKKLCGSCPATHCCCESHVG